MPRPLKKKITLNPDSLKDLLQQIWDECDVQRQQAVFQYNRWNRDVKENTDIALVGKTNNELLKIIDGAIANRIQVARLVKDYIGASTASTDAVTSTGVVSEDAKDAIFDLIQKASAANNTEYVEKPNPEAETDPF